MRILTTGVVVLALAAAAILAPVPEPTMPGPIAAGDPPPVAICAVEEGRGRSTAINLLSTGPDEGSVSSFAAGVESDPVLFTLDAAAPQRVEVSDLAVVGVRAALVESGEPSTVAAALSIGAESMSAEICPNHPHPTAVLAGGSTLSGEEFEVQLMNPYSGQARVSITVVSEAGTEVNEVLKEIVVQPRTSTVLDLTDLLPGREQLSLVINTIEGNALVVGRFFNGTDSAIWNAMPPSDDSYMLMPRSRGDRRLIVASSTAVETAYQVDVYGPDGVVAAYAEGVLQGNGFTTVDLSEFGSQEIAARILATSPVSGFFRIDREGRVGLTSGSSTPATRWLMPGLGSVPGAEALVILFNPGTEDTTVIIDGHLGLTPTEIVLPPDTVVTHRLNSVARPAVTVDSDAPIVAMWTTGRGLGRAVSMGSPIVDE